MWNVVAQKTRFEINHFEGAIFIQSSIIYVNVSFFEIEHLPCKPLNIFLILDNDASSLNAL